MPGETQVAAGEVLNRGTAVVLQRLEDLRTEIEIALGARSRLYAMNGEEGIVDVPRRAGL